MKDTGRSADGPLGDDAEALDLCDHCGEAVARADLVSVLVPDSSALHRSDPALDGRRVLRACSAEHLTALIDRYRRRPFIPEEQWAGKVCRTLAGREGPVPLGLVARLSGLSVQEAVQGVEWHNARAREWRAQYGDPGCA
ncbi:hypothetical protein ACFVVA_19805 [Kitasatospora sp. NPDC058048]|uniref:hypothetical protein n=1 Tax=Kitasatospora sp. NPDC058048 TaxID=3346313 RepID=UPI0036DA495F